MLYLNSVSDWKDTKGTLIYVSYFVFNRSNNVK